MADHHYLIADDSPTVRLSLQKMLAAEGVAKEHVLLAEDGEEALEHFRSHRPAVVFLDIRMPGLGGEDTARRMLEERPETKLVIITGADRTDDQVRRLVSLGAFELLLKPLRQRDVADLLYTIEVEAGRIIRIP